MVQVSRDLNWQYCKGNLKFNFSLVGTSKVIAEVLLVLAGHSSSLFLSDHSVNPKIVPLLHPGERESLESLGIIAHRYGEIKATIKYLSQLSSKYLCALCARIDKFLRDEYISVILQMENKILRGDDAIVSRGYSVPLSLIRAKFGELDSILIALETLTEHIKVSSIHSPGPLIDLLLQRSATGVSRIANVMSVLAEAVQKVWTAQLQAFVIHGSRTSADPIISETYELNGEFVPSCITLKSRESIIYVSRALDTVKSNRWRNQLPVNLILEHSRMLDDVLPQNQYKFDQVMSHIRISISEWMWTNVMTQKDVEDALNFLANYFLLRDGEFGLALVREVEYLKMSRMVERADFSPVIREQELNVALLRASSGTSAQLDSSLPKIRFRIPSGSLRPFLPLSSDKPGNVAAENVTFDDILLGTRIRLSYDISWPLNLFLRPSDLEFYSELFSFLSSLRHIHMRVHSCWSSLSNAQRARRQWTGLNDGGTQGDFELRRDLLRCAWGTVRSMNWFLDVLYSYVAIDVVDSEFKNMMNVMRAKGIVKTDSLSPSNSGRFIDFETLRHLHTTYLERLLSGCLLTYHTLTASIRAILDVCEHFTAQVGRWGGDVLPPLLFEGSITISASDQIGEMVKARWQILKSLDSTLQSNLSGFYDLLSSTTSQNFNTMETSRSTHTNRLERSNIFDPSLKAAHIIAFAEDGAIRKHLENLLLRLDFNGMFSEKHDKAVVNSKFGVLQQQDPIKDSESEVLVGAL